MGYYVVRACLLAGGVFHRLGSRRFRRPHVNCKLRISSFVSRCCGGIPVQDVTLHIGRPLFSRMSTTWGAPRVVGSWIVGARLGIPSRCNWALVDNPTAVAVHDSTSSR